MTNQDLIDLATDILFDAMDVVHNPQEAVRLIKKSIDILARISDRLGDKDAY